MTLLLSLHKVTGFCHGHRLCIHLGSFGVVVNVEVLEIGINQNELIDFFTRAKKGLTLTSSLDSC